MRKRPFSAFFLILSIAFFIASANASFDKRTTGANPADSLSGSYDVGGGSMDFPTIAAAAAAANAGPIVGPVVFNIYPGTYTEQAFMNHNMPTTAANTVTFRGIPDGQGNLPVMTVSGSGGANGSAFRLIGADFISIENLHFLNCGDNACYTHYGSSATDSCQDIHFNDNYVENCYMGGCFRYVQGGEIKGNRFYNNSFEQGMYVIRCSDMMVANNMIYLESTYYLSGEGIWVSGSIRCKYYYNSIYSSHCCLKFAGNSCIDCEVKNNIFQSTYDSASVYNVPLYSYNANCAVTDYNCFYAPDSPGPVTWGDSLYTTLRDFQTVTGQAMHSFDADPLFMDTSWVAKDLHIRGRSPCQGAAFALLSITTDIDGESRFNRGGPCIGADEIYTRLNIVLTPHYPPIRIAPGGGMFTFTGEIINRENTPASIDAWAIIILPDSVTYGPLILRRNLSIPGGATIIRDIRQVVPINAPPGNYSYIGCIGDYPNDIMDEHSFPFFKMFSETSGSGYTEWRTNGWFGEGDFALVSSGLPNLFSLSEVFPNPFNPTTMINFALPQAGKVTLTVFDITGREVATLVNGELPIGHHSFVFDGEGLASGIYFYELTTDGFSDTKKMVLVK